VARNPLIVNDRIVFYLSYVVMVLSVVVMLVALASDAGHRWVLPTPLAIALVTGVSVLAWPICGLVCLSLARNRSERIPVALILTFATIAPVAIPEMLRGDGEPRYEFDAIRDVRTVLSGQAAYQGVNGYYDTLECLARPSSCIPGYPSAMPSFLDVHLAQREPYGQYRHWLVPGRPVTDRPPFASPTSTRTFAYVAVPLDSRRRSFCADDTGDIFQAQDGITPTIREGHCHDPRFRAFK